MNGRFLRDARVLWNHPECAGYFRMALTVDPAVWRIARPGQFLMLGIGPHEDPLLRRPFSIHRLVRAEENEGACGDIRAVEILYKVVGRGTLAMTGWGTGTRATLLGPLGRGFDIPPGLRRAFLVGGGIGVAPLVFLAETLRQAGVETAGCAAFVGGRSSGDLLCLQDLTDLGIDAVVPCTEDGSAGEKDRVTGPLLKALERETPDIIYTCGPLPMLRAVASLAEERGIRCQVSIEARMACGMGACLGCAVAARRPEEGYRHACRDGPVLESTLMAL